MRGREGGESLEFPRTFLMQNEYKAPTLPKTSAILKLCCREWVLLTSYSVKGCTHAASPNRTDQKHQAHFI